MLENTSPWLAQLKLVRPITKLTCDTKKDVAIIGGGIAGMCTAYYLLTMTKKSVVLLEADRIAHGATGHNAGQVVPYFERPFSDIVAEYGLEKAAAAQQAMLDTWELLDEIYLNANLKTPIHRFTGYAGCTKLEDILQHLENKYLRHKAGIVMEQIYIAEEAPWLEEIPSHFKPLFSIMPQKNVLSLLETEDSTFWTALSTEKAVVNSAMFTEELAGFMLQEFPDRFVIHEKTPVTKVTTSKRTVYLETAKCTVTAKKAVLCTNGFEHFEIVNKDGFPIDGKFHMTINGVIGYMAGYIEPMDKSPVAISYFKGDLDEEGRPLYFYLTRRPFETEKNMRHNLVCIGGPEKELVENKEYVRTRHHFAEKTLHQINSFLKSTYKPFPKDPTELIFHWHGLMGYTRNLLRLIGEEPCNTNLLYNLGCNGVGILPSIFGGKRIASILRGDRVPKMIFDPVDKRSQVM